MAAKETSEVTTEQYADAYTAGFHRTVGFLMRNGARRTEDAKDFAQDAWLKGFTRCDTLRRDIAVLSWVNKIALNLWRSYWRTHDIERDALEPVWNTDTLSRHGMPSATIGTWDIDRRKLMRIAAESDREFLRDYYVDGYSSVELGSRWGASQQAMKLRVMRATDRLRQQVHA